MERFFEILNILIIVWNLWVFLIMGVDKRKAKKGRRRIPERTLLLSALAFGALGGLIGMHLFHHKTRHKRFRYGLPIMLILQLALSIYLTFYI